MKRSASVTLSFLAVTACSVDQPVDCNVFKDDARCSNKPAQQSTVVVRNPFIYMPYHTTQPVYMPLTTRQKSIMYTPQPVSRPLSLPPQVSRGGFGRTSIMASGG